jgi:class 3 adenylate cyclase
VTGSTSLGETLDPERLRSLLARYLERMKTIVERHGGTVEKFIGDAVMAVFGSSRSDRRTEERENCSDRLCLAVHPQASGAHIVAHGRSVLADKPRR